MNIPESLTDNIRDRHLDELRRVWSESNPHPWEVFMTDAQRAVFCPEAPSAYFTGLLYPDGRYFPLAFYTPVPGDRLTHTEHVLPDNTPAFIVQHGIEFDPTKNYKRSDQL